MKREKSHFAISSQLESLFAHGPTPQIRRPSQPAKEEADTSLPIAHPRLPKMPTSRKPASKTLPRFRGTSISGVLFKERTKDELSAALNDAIKLSKEDPASALSQLKSLGKLFLLRSKEAIREAEKAQPGSEERQKLIAKAKDYLTLAKKNRGARKTLETQVARITSF